MSDRNLVKDGITYYPDTSLWLSMSSIWIELDGSQEFKNKIICGLANVGNGWALRALGTTKNIPDVRVEFSSISTEALDDAITSQETNQNVKFNTRSVTWEDAILGIATIVLSENVEDNWQPVLVVHLNPDQRIAEKDEKMEGDLELKIAA